jgi:asparagine synthase (glutamine-hydrolysing)
MHFTGEFMLKVDGGTMFSSLEARAPFLDHKLWEFAAQLPPSLHLAGGELKAILRTIARRRIGEFVATKPKQGFTVPVSDWLAGQQRHQWAEMLSGSILIRDGWVEEHGLRQAIEHCLQQGRIRPALWHLLVLEHWMRRHESSMK